MVNSTQGGCGSCRMLLRPCTPGLLTLGILVMLWGLGYKLSLYHRHVQPGSRQVAKLWVEHRGAAVMIVVAPRHRQPHAVQLRALLVPVERCCRLSEVAGVRIPGSPERSAPPTGRLAPPRAPPA